jgi:hypothetical protein
LTVRISADHRYRRAMATALFGDVIWPTDDKYDASRAVFNAVIDRRPLAILRCHDPSDVRRGIAYARSHDLPLAVKGGGHNVAGNAVCDDGLVLDPRVSQFLLIMFRRRPRLRERRGFLAGWPAQDMGGEIWRR